MNYKYILFDLDGTLTDPKKGITKSVAHALKKMRDIEVDPDTLTKFIGPPLLDSFIEYYDFSEDEAYAAIESYREYFKVKGLYENVVYEGIKELLEQLKNEGKDLYVATSKPTVFAEKILNHFGLKSYFTHVVGSNLDGSRTNKGEVIQTVLDKIPTQNKKEMIMIGDRKHDILGAEAVDLDSIGVEYGYGVDGELKEAGANYIVDTVKDLSKLLLG